MNDIIPSISVDVVPTHGTLLCPECGNSNLHHERVEVFWRAAEDAPSRGIACGTGDGFLVKPGDPVLALTIGDNPSPRRNGLLVYFVCEHCPLSKVLAIWQHKGSTYLEWKPR
jgi:hypothetical protein